ncbi:hypothetical protein FWP33_20430 [Vibrio parahaemolyticus]|jgi:conjugal transfer pilus assembly protein TraF|uniref:Conjugal transfer protein TraF n=1 Tax=Vibrio parahaemolyticus TaxID=670 RepID=A0A9Q3YHG6_VIBPH|nr:conjugal transfer protein TraF [Vibrio parahaemolyticus]ELA8176731.1 conjugal transfer protein TraF [Vibrio alginolyticus]EGQ9744868.1 hypothetical protein [Vibrio parahaemolyticus]EJC7176170.1 conjugal transfer protein TraF [Vibrio parahaemolyticus]EJG0009903.1 conjugal transfer protein TraF [Vibrio parahaemolyticus]MCC3803803.1 conjugal transfer protein TraF [Vibrio parahaemolyticus]
MNRVFKRAVLSGLIACNFSQLSFAANELHDFQKDYQPDGWYFYHDPVEEKEPVLEPVKPAPKEEKKEEPKEEKKEDEVEVKITSAWLRENLPLLLDEAQDNPSYENVRRYMYAQRVALDRATQFATFYGQVAQREEALNENLRRPIAGNQLLALSREITRVRKEIVASKYDDFGIMFFISSTCPYCSAMAGELDKIKRKYPSLDVLPVSIDGAPLPGRPKWAAETVYDDGTLTSVMPVDVTPTFYMINKKTGDAAKMAANYLSSDSFETLMFDVMHLTNVIDNNEYQSAKHVKDILLIPDAGDEPLKVNEKELYENPDYLSDKLRKEFEDRYLGPNREFTLPGAVVPKQN